MINWLKIGEAVEWYKSIGYSYIEVPWIVSDDPYNFTRPATAPAYSTLGGNLVASGEQSFMELMDKQPIGKAVCCTPCFRVEPEYNNLSRPYFVKVELIFQNGGNEELLEVINDALTFFESQYQIPCEVIQLENNTYDIVSRKNKIELGSYGFRDWKNHTWVYGTGLAEPRASAACALEGIVPTNTYQKLQRSEELLLQALHAGLDSDDLINFLKGHLLSRKVKNG